MGDIYSTEDRATLGRATGDALLAVGTMLRSKRSDPAEARAIGIVTQMAGELILGSVDLAGKTNYYASLALHRQLIEVFHLLDFFANDSSGAARWLGTSDGDFASPSSEFKPSALRRAGGFDGTQYSQHCGLAGHPRPAGRVVLPEGEAWVGPILATSQVTGRDISILLEDLVLCDALLHARTTYLAAGRAVDALGRTDNLAERLAPTWADLETWAREDPGALIMPRRASTHSLSRLILGD
ncbi:hypothetical protein OOJ91_11910 [Micromonospora lupini]|uniref:hypothetical protein n=1 Tax=Micromonospora lupini TaxID=285679 RepID=UPI0022564F7F|nr:hypothetical protein [Micromonospora lupini]MCX5066582.1 hypothetical protein [Micromonospora lupini]